MNRKILQFLISGTMLLLLTALSATALASSALPGQEKSKIFAAPAYTYDEVITVTTTSDDGGTSSRCEQVAADQCTLRRAINEVRYHQYDHKTYLIRFNISTGDSGYNAAHQVWIINVDSDNSGSNQFAFRDFGAYGHVIIDGDTQPAGRSNGPRIILRGDNNKGVFTLTGGYNIIRGLAFQGFGDRVISIPGTGTNLIEDNWFGLSIDGTEIYLRDAENPEAGSGETGIYIQSGSAASGNTLQNNALAGFDADAMVIDGDTNYVFSNTIGTRADGTLPEIRSNRKCHPNARYYNWFGGGGIQIYGETQQVAHNRVAGMLYQSADPWSTPEDAISVTGDNNQVYSNTIGIDANGQHFGVCGEAIHVGGSNGIHSIRVYSNTLVGSRGQAAIFVTAGLSGYDLDSIYLAQNIIKESANEAFDFGETVPEVLATYQPAIVSNISGLNVSGTAGANSPCAGCRIELFLDNVDTVTETRQTLAVVTANGSGNWTATLPRTLALTEGIRTASTSLTNGQIPHPSIGGAYYAPTTVRISKLYTQTGAPAPTQPPAETPQEPLPIPAIQFIPPPTMPTAFNTVITVTSAADPDNSPSATCSSVSADSCTLRRALVEADALMDANPSARPVHITFNIPTSDPQYDSANGVWIIQLYDSSGTYALPTLGSTDISKSGQVVIDGASQPGGRSSGPKIIVRGGATYGTNQNGLVINGEHNVVRGLAFQRLKNHLQLNHSGNTVENNWFGLNTAGNDVYLRSSAHPEYGSGSGAVTLASASGNNLLQNNVFLGLTGAAINMEGGDDNYVQQNYIGTRSNGTINAASVDEDSLCNPSAANDNWFGGEGINLRGKRNQVLSNTLVALLVQGGSLQTPPDAINVTDAQDNLLQNNRIGVDATGAAVWTCGAGIDVASATYTQIFSNTIINAHASGIFLSGDYAGFNANQMRGNIISGTTTAIEFNQDAKASKAVSLFTPARASIDGLQVSGSSGDDCPFCWIDVYLDDDDSVSEALAYLGSAIADVNGNWSFTLATELKDNQGLRLLSTPRSYGIIPYFEAGTSSRLSDLYQEKSMIYLPLVLK